MKTEDYKEDEDNAENLTGRIYLLEKKIEDKKYIYQYKYHRKCGNNIDLRCRDYKCKGTAQIQENGEIIEKTKCTIEYVNHSYTKKILAKEKIEKNEQTVEDMNDLIYQEAYFQHYLTQFPMISYDEIVKLFIQNYPKIEIKFTNKQFHNLKFKLKENDIKTVKDIDIIDNLKFLDEIMLKLYLKFLNEEDNYSEIRIFGTNETLKELNNKEIKQYFIDGTYKVIPNIENVEVLVLIIGNKGYPNSNSLCCAILMSDEREETYIRLYNELKNKNNFIPSFLTCDFALANINAIKSVYKNNNVKIITCFFHLIQAWWRKANVLGLRRNDIKEKTKFLMINLKLLAFMELKEAFKYYELIKSNEDLQDERFESFFKYMETTWLGYFEKKKNKEIYREGKYPFELWNYYDKLNLNSENEEDESNKLNLENKIEKYLSYTNNNVESINSYIKTKIPFGKKLTPTIFNEIMKNLFLRYKTKRKSNEIQLNLQPMIYKRNLTDFLIDIVKIRSNKYLITKEQMTLLKHNYDEKILFDLED